tara:strand:- start:3334 stop:3522 length:189 start_codon:yes stop_codon:yes gene_type:complete
MTRRRPQPSYFVVKIDDETVDAIEDVCQEIAIDNVMASDFVWELMMMHFVFQRSLNGPSIEA